MAKLTENRVKELIKEALDGKEMDSDIQGLAELAEIAGLKDLEKYVKLIIELNEAGIKGAKVGFDYMEAIKSINAIGKSAFNAVKEFEEYCSILGGKEDDYNPDWTFCVSKAAKSIKKAIINNLVNSEIEDNSKDVNGHPIKTHDFSCMHKYWGRPPYFPGRCMCNSDGKFNIEKAQEAVKEVFKTDPEKQTPKEGEYWWSEGKHYLYRCDGIVLDRVNGQGGHAISYFIIDLFTKATKDEIFKELDKIRLEKGFVHNYDNPVKFKPIKYINNSDGLGEVGSSCRYDSKSDSLLIYGMGLYCIYHAGKFATIIVEEKYEFGEIREVFGDKHLHYVIIKDNHIVSDNIKFKLSLNDLKIISKLYSTKGVKLSGYDISIVGNSHNIGCVKDISIDQIGLLIKKMES